MIDLRSETLLSIAEAAKRLPGRRPGKCMHRSVLYRWAERGIRGIRLETIAVGGTRYTSEEAIQRFAEALSEPDSVVRTTSKGAERAMRELKGRHGF